MTKKMLIDATHPEETRVAVVNGTRLEEFDFEIASKRQIKSNIYLAKVTRVEPSLQAAFVEYGGNRHGFLPFPEIHSDYYRIPVSDRPTYTETRDHRRHNAPVSYQGHDNEDSEAETPASFGTGDQPAYEYPVPGEHAVAPEPESRDADEPEAEPLAPAEAEPAAEPEAHAPAEAAAEPAQEAAAIAPAEPVAEAVEAPAEDVIATGAAETEGETPTEPGIVMQAAAVADPMIWEDPPVEPPEPAAEIESAGGEFREADSLEPGEEPTADEPASGDAPAGEEAVVDVVGGDEVEDAQRRRRSQMQHYKIQEVIKRRQIMLVQVSKEERGNKGAAVTTFLSLPGRYCVLMPNTARGGGVSRKIANPADRKRMKELIADLEVPDGMSVILRTAGLERSKAEIKRDLEYLLRLWENIRTLTLESTAPALIYEEGNLIKRAIRDLYSRDIEEIEIAGEEGYRQAKDFMRMLMPSHAKRVQPYRDPSIPLFFRYGVETQIDLMHNPVAHLKSGGYIVINQTEALVSIDVNSGRSTRERNIEETALKTNCEAADEIARQLRLRDMGGLIVIDFIDMDEPKHDAQVERRLKEAMKDDRARIQVGRISPFGLLELSRQRLHPSLVETNFHTCAHCLGTGLVRSIESSALLVLRAIEEEGVKRRSAELGVTVAGNIALYILNQKRGMLIDIEQRYGFSVRVMADDSLIPPEHRIERIRMKPPGSELPPVNQTNVFAIEERNDIEEDEAEEAEEVVAETTEEGVAESAQESDRKRKRKRSRRRRGRDASGQETPGDGEPGQSELSSHPEGDGGDSEEDRAEEAVVGEVSVDQETAAAQEAAAAAEEAVRRRRRGRRGGRSRSRRTDAEGNELAPQTDSGSDEFAPPALAAEGDALAETAPAEAAFVDAAAAPHWQEPATAPAEEPVAAAEPVTSPPAETIAPEAVAPEPDASDEPALAEPVEPEPVAAETAEVEPEPVAPSAPAQPAAREYETVNQPPTQPRRGFWKRFTE